MKKKFVLITKKPVTESISTEQMWEVSSMDTRTKYFIHAETRQEAIEKAINSGIKKSNVAKCYLSNASKAYQVYLNCLDRSSSIAQAAALANDKGFNCLVDCQDSWYSAVNNSKHAE